MLVEEQQLVAFILDKKILDEAALNDASEKAKTAKIDLGDYLVKEHLIDEKTLAELEAYILGVPFIDLSQRQVTKETLQVIPEATARKEKIIAFSKGDEQLKVAMLNPRDLQVIDFVKKKTGLKVVPHLTTKEGFSAALKQYQESLQVEFGEIISDSVKSGSDKEKDLHKIAEDLPTIKIVDTLLKHAIIQKSSDIHIEPLEKEVIVRYRLDGILHDAMTLPKQVYAGIVARIKVLSKLKIDEHRLPQDGRFKISSDEYKISFRVSILPTFYGEKVVMRLLDESSQKLNLDQIGFLPGPKKALERNIKKPNGMILVTGPTGSGKTTTLYTVLEILNTPEVNISTVEDPIEYQLPRVNQTQVQPKIDLTFSSGLRALLRQDPDIIMVGEIRDEETAEIALHAALTGHLVLSTLHTNSAAGSLPRLIDMGIEPFLVASSVNVIVAQRLVRKLCPECKEEHTLNTQDLKSLEESFNLDDIMTTLKKEGTIDSKVTDFSKIKIYHGKGCSKCRNSGYKGRLGIFEVLELTDNLGELISQKEATSDEIEKLALQEGMVTMVHDGFTKVAQGATTIDEIIRVTKE